MTIFLLLICAVCFGQNLVPNPSFEQHTACPHSTGQLSSCIDWSSFGNSPDYFHGCSTYFGYAPPNSVWGYQAPHSDSAYASIILLTGWDDYRELIGVQLSATLIVGQKYFVSFFTNFAFQETTGRIASNKIGLRFSTISYSDTALPPVNNFAHVYFDSIISDTALWVKISGSFVADSAYRYLAIGNFFQSNLIDTIHVGTTSPGGYSMYYIDDVCVSTDSVYNEMWTQVKNVSSTNDFAKVFPNPFSTQLRFSLDDNQSTTLTLYNFTGQQILQQTFTNTATINTEQMPCGIYFYALRNTNGSFKTGKLLKQ